MNSILNEARTLILNAHWQAIGVKTPEQSMKDMSSGAFLGMVIEGTDKMYPVGWEDWLKLDPLDEMYSVRGVNRTYRLPTVIIAKNFHRMPTRTAPCNRDGIIRRDKGRCQYTGKVLKPEETTLDHVVPRSRGGKRSWDNLVTCHVEVNRMKGNRMNQEAGLKLLSRPREPKQLPVIAFIKNKYQVPEWDMFLIKSDQAN